MKRGRKGKQLLLKANEFVVEAVNMFDMEDQPLPASCIELRPYEENDDVPDYPIFSSVELNQMDNQSSSYSEMILRESEHSPIFHQIDQVKQIQHKRIHQESPQTLSKEFEMSAILMKKVHIIENIIIEKSNSAIFKYPIGFQSDEESQPQSNQLQFPSLSSEIVKIQEAQHHQFSHYHRDNEEKIKQQRKDAIRSRKLRKCNLFHDSSNGNQLCLTKFQEDLRKGCFKVSEEDKKLFIQLRTEVEKLFKYITEQAKKNAGSDHFCKMCGIEFKSGRQLGGHMSRKHPGKSTDYKQRKEIRKNKFVEKSRRYYFKMKNLQSTPTIPQDERELKGAIDANQELLEK